MIWFTSDWHVGHKNVLKLSKRPFKTLQEMQDAFVRNLSTVVLKTDIVYHLGDFNLGAAENAKKVLAQLPGTHILIRGNHDKGAESMKNLGFTLVLESATIKIGGKFVLLRHHPYRPSFWWRIWQIMRGVWLKDIKKRPVNRGGWLLCGHTHQKDKKRGKMINVGVDAWNFRPVNAGQIESLMKDDK